MSDINKNINYPIVGNLYKVITGPYIGFHGKCVSIDMSNNLPVILQYDKWETRAVKLNEIELIESNPQISIEQKN